MTLQATIMIGISFMSFEAGHFQCCWFFLLKQIDWNFYYVFFLKPFLIGILDFWILTSLLV